MNIVSSRKRVHGGFWQCIQGRLIFLLLIVLVPVVLAQAYIFNDRVETRRVEELQSNLEIARAISKNFTSFIEDILRSEMVMGMALAQPISETEKYRMLDKFQAETPAVRSAFWVDTEGLITASSLREGVGYRIDDRAYFQRISGGEDWVISDLMIGKTTGKPCFMISRGVRDEQGKLAGVFVVSIEPDTLDHALGVTRSEGGGVSIMDSKGMLVYRYPHINPTWEQRYWLDTMPQIRKALAGEEIAWIGKTVYTDKTRIMANVPISSTGWSAGAGRSEEDAMAPIASALWRHGILFSLIVMSASGIALAFSRRMSISINRLCEQAVARGDGQGSPVVIDSGLAEIKDLAASINMMADKIEARESALRESEERFRTALGGSPINVSNQDLNLRYTWIYNPELGYSPEDVLGKTDSDLLPADTVERLLPIKKRVLKSGITEEAQISVQRSGQLLHFDFHVSPFRDKAGTIIGITNVVVNITERKKIEEALRASEEKLRSIFRAAPVGIGLTGDRIILDANEHLCKITGYGKKELINAPARMLYPSDEEYEWVGREKYHQISESGTGTVETIWKKKDGSSMNLILSSSPLDLSDLSSGVTFTALDITRRKLAEEAVRESEERYRGVVQNTSAVILRVDPKGIIRFANERALEFFGYSEDELIGSHAVGTIIPERETTGRDLAAMVEEIAANPDRFHSNANENTRKNGERVWMEWTNSGIYDADGNLREFLSVGIDATERKRMAEALKASEDRFRRIFESNMIPIAFWQKEGALTEANQAFCTLLGCTPEEVGVGKIKWSDVTPPEIGWRDRQGIDELKERGSCTPYENQFIHRDGHIVPVIIGGGTIGDSGDQGVAFAVDLSARKRMEEELRRSRDELELRVQERTAELERSNRALQDFASIASHDMKEPLRKVISFGNILRHKHGASLGETGSDYLKRMLDATQRMQNLLTSLLEYSRITTNQESFHEVDLYDIIHEVLSDLEVRISKAEGEVQVGKLPTITADATQIRQLFQNLISNALKFHKDGEKPVVKISCDAAETANCRIIVEDNGIGFDEQFLDRIFAPFQRLHGRNSQYEGNGMGLAICTKIVERHGGKITAKSKPGEGSVFEVTLPVGTT